jgi:speckle-type POZ protein
MSSFTGVSVVTDGKHCTTSDVVCTTDCGYHLLMVKEYSRTVQEIPIGKEISSGPFVVGGHKWHIDYCPNSDRPSCTDFISLYLRRDDDIMEEAVGAKFEFSFVDEVEYQKPVRFRATETCNFSSETPSRGFCEFVRRDELEQSANLKDDCFTIRCDIMICKDTTQYAGGTMPDISHHFNNLLQSNVGADVTFEVSGETFLAHRCVLAARSTVFMAQLFGPMAEKTTSSAIEIKDMEAKVFAALLRFIYTDSFPKVEEEEGQDEEESVEGKMSEVVEEGQEEDAIEQVIFLRCVQWVQHLFVAADRYDIQRLKFLCEDQLSNNIGVSCVLSTLALAEQHHCPGLKEACLKFIQVQSPKCLDKIMASDDWEHITTTYPSVLKELISKLASNQKEKKRKHESM